MPTSERPIIEFGPFRLDLRNRSATRDGAPLAIGLRAFAVLAALATELGNIVGKAALIDRVWMGLTVEENNLQVQISALRKVLGEDWITTLPGRGYRLAVPERPTRRVLAVDSFAGQPSIAVERFAGVDDGPAQCFLSEHLAENIVTELSRDRALTVLARHGDIQTRYLVRGSLRHEAARTRISVQLVETANGSCLWAERYDRARGNTFAVQDEIAEIVTAEVSRAIASAEQHRMLRNRRHDPSSWEAHQRGMWRLLQNTPQEAARSRDDFRQACEIDPAFASGHSGCALSYLSEAIFHGTLGFFDAGTLAEVEARKAVAIDPNDSDANAALSHALFNTGNFDAAQEYASRAVALNHHSVWAHTANATVQVFSGRYTEGRNAARASLRLNPHHPTSPLMPTAIIASLYWEGSYDAVLKGARRCLSEFPAFAPTRRYVVASLGQLGRIAEAEVELQKFMAIAPKVFCAVVCNRPSFLQRTQQEDLLEGFRKAGWQY